MPAISRAQVESSEPLDCVVIGAGPAGLTAGLYLRRFRRSVEVIDAGASRALMIPESYNYPGFPTGIPGRELLGLMTRQLERVGGTVRPDTATDIGRRSDGLQVGLDSGTVLTTRTVILCTGVKDHEPQIPGVDRVKAAGLLRQCPICDAHEYSDKRIAVLGDSEHSVNETIFLRHFTADISFYVNSRTLAPALRTRLQDAGVAVIDGAPAQLGVAGERAVVSMDGSEEQRYDAVYSALGVTPRASLAQRLGVKLDDCDNILVDAHCRTSVEHVYAAGDIVAGLNQVAVSIGQAAVAATAVHNSLPRGFR